MNEKNVEALFQLVRECNKDAGAYRYGAGDEELARYLAEQGVLAPSALTDLQARTIYGDYHDAPDRCRHLLEKFARGEA